MPVDESVLHAFRARAYAPGEATAAASATPDLEALARALGSLLSAARVPFTDFRMRGELDADGCGWVIEELPFGGSVIEGYHERLIATLANGVVIRAAINGEYGGVLEPLTATGEPGAAREALVTIEARLRG